jgi:hypothetical protein
MQRASSSCWVSNCRFPSRHKGNALYGFVILKETGEYRDRENLIKEINQQVSNKPIAKLDKIQFVSGLPKTRSGKIMRRILRKIAEGDYSNFGDTSTYWTGNVEEIRTVFNLFFINFMKTVLLGVFFYKKSCLWGTAFQKSNQTLFFMNFILNFIVFI